ncbi:sacsin N-terminal ATP-binding-like domain-containing protein [Chloroflexota bacterium]
MPAVPETPRQHIARIRREKFGLTDDGTVAPRNPLAEDLHRAVDELSQGLYSKDIHFVLELVQNAEDNSYSDSANPDLTFYLLGPDASRADRVAGALLLVNNEAGFRPQDVDALCAVGKTTKDKREGYIGEKGIGFKSVFRVTTRPCLFSAGYSFNFNREPDPDAGFGFIIPNWIHHPPSEVQNHPGRTCIYLPLDEGQYNNVAEQLQQIAPETILFLSKLEALSVWIDDEPVVRVVRDDSKRPLVEFLSGERYARYWVFSRELDVPADMHEEKRYGVDTRAVSVAFPLESDGLLKGDVFAFLPTEVNTGFPFLINADYILSASRETLQLDRPWNQWLRDAIVPAFVDAFMALLHHTDHRLEPYAFIPLDDETRDDFFAPVAHGIQTDLSERAVVWTTGGDQPLSPDAVRLAPAAFRALLGYGPVPAQLMDTPLVHPKIQRHARRLRAIGVSDLSSDELLACLKDDDWLAAQTLEWFVQLYEYLRRQDQVTSDRLIGANLIPLDSGGIASVGERNVYYPSDDAPDERTLRGTAPTGFQIAYLNSELHALLRDDEDLLTWLSQALHVQTFTVGNFCLDLAQALYDNRASISVQELVRATEFIRDHYEQLEAYTQYCIRVTLPLALAGDEIILPPDDWPAHEPLILPETSDPETGWQLVFPSPRDRSHMSVLSDAYLAGLSSAEERAAQCAFLTKLGATASPAPHRPAWHYKANWDPPDGLTDNARLIIRPKFLHSSSKGFKLLDWLAPRWLWFMDDRNDAGDPLLDWTEERALALVKWIGKRSDWLRSEEAQAKYEWFYYVWEEQTFCSELQHALKEKAWFPSTHGPLKPSEVFLDKPELRELFGDALPCALQNPRPLVAKWIGLRLTATADELVAYLKQIASHSAESADPKIVAKIYNLISERWDALAFSPKLDIRHDPLILSTKPEPIWVKPKQTVWPDLESVFGDTYVYLETQYHERLRGFFVDQLEVADRLDDELYAKALAHLAEQEEPDPEAAEAALERIFPVLLKVVTRPEVPEWWADYAEDAKVWTQSDRFEPASSVFIPDDGELKRLFKEEGVEFAWRPEHATFSEYAPLYDSLGVRLLSREVEVDADLQPLSEPAEPDLLWTPGAKLALCWSLWNSGLSHLYERGRESILVSLLRTHEMITTRLILNYELNGFDAENPDGIAYFEMDDDPVLYRLDSAPVEELEVEVPVILARAIAEGRSSYPLENLIGRVLGASEAKAQALIRKHNWSMPAEEQEWIANTMGAAVAPPDPSAQVTSGDGSDDLDSGAEEADASSGDDSQSTAQTGAAGTQRGPGSTGTTHPGGGRRATGEETDSSVHDGSDSVTQATTAGSGDDSQQGGASAGSASGRSSRDGPRPHGRSYLRHAGSQDSQSQQDLGVQERRAAIERAGIEVALEYERQSGRIPLELDRVHPGWDVDSYDPDPNAAQPEQLNERYLRRRIEVKAKPGAWDGYGVMLTPEQRNQAERFGPEYFLYVVEYALEPDRTTLYIFSDPVAKITEYRIDDRWTQFADQEIVPDRLST